MGVLATVVQFITRFQQYKKLEVYLEFILSSSEHWFRGALIIYYKKWAKRVCSLMLLFGGSVIEK